tara:strand:+ start:939 stop:2210 length:1272 start_codon:yes stop_codon:yes gene_type:complete
MRQNQRKLDKSYCLFKDWWDSTELTNYEKCLLNNEIITFNQQLLRLKEKRIRIGVCGKAGVGKSSLLNNMLQENFFNTGILNGSTINYQSKNMFLKNCFIKKIELVDSPGFDICSFQSEDKWIGNLLSLDLILFVTSGDLNREELNSLLFLIKQGKSITIIINKVDIWQEEEVNLIKQKINEKIPQNCKIPIITYSTINCKLSNKNKIHNYLNHTLNRVGDGLLINNTFQIANKLALSIKEERLLKRKHKAQSLIGKFATLKATSVALNPMLFIDMAGSVAFDTVLISELSRIYGLKLKGKSASKLLKSLSFSNIFLGVTQIGINSSFNLIKKISLILAPLTNGLSLLPYGPVAIVQALLAIQITKHIGKLAAKEILDKSNTNNLEPFKFIQQIALQDPAILSSNNYFLNNQINTKDYSIFIP